MIEELVREKDKWHRRYNDALIENAKLSKANEDYELAIHRLIMERDMAIKDMCGVEECIVYACEYCANGHCDINANCRGFIWRGVKR